MSGEGCELFSCLEKILTHIGNKQNRNYLRNNKLTELTEQDQLSKLLTWDQQRLNQHSS
jgi:hypothetical protein